MPKSVSEYTLADWRRLRPITHALKTRRYRLVDRRYMRQPARSGDTAAVSRALVGQNVLATIAFNDPQALDWQARLLRYYVPLALHVIVDNSSDESAAAEIAKLAARFGLPYVRLPENPWDSFSRSHGIALNWAWRNVLREGEPRAFGFLDDDLYPTAPEDPFAPLLAQNFYGLVREAGSRWFLWAGYCTFLFEAVQDQPLDFGQDWFNGLDTGGANWDVLYRHVNRTALQEPESRFVSYKADIEVREGPLQWCGGWLHEVGTMGNPALATEKRRTVAEILAPHLTAAESKRPQ